MSYGKAFFAKLFCASKKATVSRAFAKRAPFLLLLSGTKEVSNRVGDCSLFEQSTSHTTVRTVRYTAVQIPSHAWFALSLSLLSRAPTLGTPAHPSRSTLSLCRQPFRYSAFIMLDSFLQLLKTGICSVLPVKKNGTMTSADFSQQALLRISDFLLYVCETSPGKNDNFHSM